MIPNEEGKYPPDYDGYEKDASAWMDNVFYIVLLTVWLVLSYIVTPLDVYVYVLFFTAIFIAIVYVRT